MDTWHSIRKEGGFTLMELLVVLMTLSMVLLSVGALLQMTQGNYATYKQISDYQQSFSGAMEMMVREMRQAIAIEVAEDQRLQFRDLNNTLIEFQLISGQLYRKEGDNQAELMLADVNSLDFDYYDLLDQTTTATGEVKRIAITLTSIVNSKTLKLQNSVQIRNNTSV